MTKLRQPALAGHHKRLKRSRPASTNNKLARQAGFTLVELLITIVLVTIISLTLANFLANWLQASAPAQARSGLLTNAETALDTISDDIRLSGSADQNNRWTDQNSPTSPSNNYGWQSSDKTLVLAKAAVDQNRNIIFSDASKYISQKDNQIYYLSDSTLYRRTLASSDASDAARTTCPPASANDSCPADKKIASDVTSFSVHYYDSSDKVAAPNEARSIELSIELTKTQNGKPLKASYNTKMVFRNE